MEFWIGYNSPMTYHSWCVAYLSLGSNMGDRLSLIERAVLKLKIRSHLSFVKVSPLYKTQPVGGPNQKNYLNCVVKIRTRQSVSQLLSMAQSIEKSLGRQRSRRWGPRTLDIDILTYGSRTFHNSKLQIPHPRYHKRRFVLVPFCRIAPRLRHPSLKTQNQTLLRQLTPQGQRVTMVAQWKKSRFIPS